MEVGPYSTITGTIKDLKEWLKQFNDNDVIEIGGGSDSGWEFVEIKVNNKVMISS